MAWTLPSRLRRWLGLAPRPTGMMAHTSGPPPARLGLDQLPEALGVLPRSSPAALLWQDTEWARHWAPALIGDALVGGPVFILAQDAGWVDSLLSQAALRQAWDAQRLRIWLTSEGMTGRVRRDGLAPVIADLRQVGLTRQHALFVVGGHDWLLEQDTPHLLRMADDLRRWSARRKRPVAFCFHAAPDPQDLLVRLRHIYRTFHHIATLTSEAGRPAVWLDRWSGTRGAVFQCHYGLRLDTASGRLTYDGTWTRGQDQQLVEAPDQHDVVATAAAVAGLRGVPPHWRIVDDLAAVAPALRQSTAATVVLHAGGLSDFDPLARLVHHLRLTHPRSLKILVRENQSKLRSHSEQALLKVGANAVAYREVGFARLLQKIQELGMQAYTATVPTDLDQVLTGYAPLPRRGYLAPRVFVEAARVMLERSTPCGLIHSLVRLPMLPQVPHLDALRACTPVRDGDLLTADRDSLYLFLFACAETDLAPALERLFAIPADQLFSSQIHDHSAEGIAQMLRALAEAEQRGLPDYTDALPTPSRRVAAPDVCAAPTPQALPASPPAAPAVAAPAWATAPAQTFARPVGRRPASAPAGESP